MSVITLRLNDYEEPRLYIRVKPEAVSSIKQRFENDIIDQYPEDGAFLFGKRLPWGGFDVEWSIYQNEVEAQIKCWDKFGEVLPLDDLDVRLNALVWIKAHIKPEEIAI